jgi:hypothetical protein
MQGNGRPKSKILGGFQMDKFFRRLVAVVLAVVLVSGSVYHNVNGSGWIGAFSYS